MIDKKTAIASRRRSGTSLLIGVAAVLLVFVVSGTVSYLNTRTLDRDARQVTHTHEVLSALGELLSLMKDAETGQRGYLLTGDDRYLEPYSSALARIDQRMGKFEGLIRDDSDHRTHLPALKANINTKLEELAETVELRRTQGFEAARATMMSDRGKAAMDALRTLIQSMQEDERIQRALRIAEMDNAYRVAIGSGILTGVLGALLSVAVGSLLRQAMLTRQRQDWLQSGQIGLAKAMAGEQRLEQLGESVLKFLADYLDAHAGVFFAKNGSGFRRVATYGVPALDGTPAGFEPGDGLLGQAVKDGRAILVRDVPDGYLTFGSALGHGKPRHLVIAPVAADDAVKGVLELGFVHSLDGRMITLLDTVSSLVGVAVKSANYRTHLQNLLEETQRQAEELQAQGEELRVSNEELEEQGRALKESQVRLEHQQAELEQSNVQLEEQTAILETQRDDLLQTKEALQLQARGLEQASRYKSDFLANMSHELRTPLNSSLILAKLLADNPQGNLSEEQVKYAQTIRSAGNDLLVLINDILDLSKIEAGRMEVRPEPVSLAQLVDDLRRTFEPVAAQKGLAFHTLVSPACPETINTDCQRLEQVLKNILSNALKFTEQGEVKLNVSRAADGRISFAVTDTGIGIPEHQHQVVFEAFRQADGTTNRKYGGTGLGLSISRELTRLLGGDIRLATESGRGSTFNVTIPELYSPALVRPRDISTTVSAAQVAAEDRGASLPAIPPVFPRERANRLSAPSRARQMDDDRERLAGGRRIILAVEDDESFARILYDLAHELDFQCLIATTAEEALAVAVQYLPNAVVLDVGLPDYSGLSVLDRLKHDARTRHIPVHVVSAGDYAQTALSLGAVGYMLKPVKREELVEALKQLETRLAQRMRRVLVVEDDPVQLDSMRRLLDSVDVETVGAGTAAECLEQLKEATFDCMVLDLSLPDASGYSLLETLSREDAYAFPPVIVYTGRDLPADEEQRLRRYSNSIIIKGAKSPERLLDEVTLFLHQVVSELPPEQQRMLEKARSRDAALEDRRILVVEDDVRNVFALTSIFEPRGAVVQIARNGREAIALLEDSLADHQPKIDLVLMDVMMPEMDGLTATREIRQRPEWKKLPIIMLTAKAMKDDQARCLEAGATDYMAKPLDVEKLLSLVRVWMPR
ncbi:response regulator [Singulisphaera acidiphila]|uniref:histidine kinase n=1 Tax=Singulisphaera acidiphila (strain ATCC BAA-1392 / DSM 18658 / VKM B-2454 / MOB10) TaxID=886293 RepID=L0D790_SINAD|nr:response regulator [Singulisphaera acidiphila]AGA24735.1 signal transduction histidine kinase [Singulisphaera acidiphila DSM 18658]